MLDTIERFEATSWEKAQAVYEDNPYGLVKTFSRM